MEVETVKFEKMTKKLLIVGAGADALTAIALKALKEKHGNDIELVTAEEAAQRGLSIKDFENTQPMKLINPLGKLLIQSDFKTGKQLRTERRAKERKQNKRRKK